MTRQQAKDLLPVITAFAEGKEIQKKTSGEWKTYLDFDFDASPTLYRIKPQPREFWIMGDRRFLSFETAVNYRDLPSTEIIHVREVISEE